MVVHDWTQAVSSLNMDSVSVSVGILRLYIPKKWCWGWDAWNHKALKFNINPRTNSGFPPNPKILQACNTLKVTEGIERDIWPGWPTFNEP